MAAMIVYLGLCILLLADSAVVVKSTNDNDNQCLGGVVVNQALQLQQQALQLQQQENQLQQQENQLQEQSDQLRSLQDKVRSMEAHLEWNVGNLTALNKSYTKQDKVLQQQSDELHGLQDKVKAVETDLEWKAGNLTALSSSHSQQDSVLQQQAEQLNSLQDKVEGMEADLEWKIGNLTALTNAHSEQVAFSVRYNDWTAMNVGSQGTLKYNVITTNVGDGYSPLTGHFTAPYDGIYAFFSSLRTMNDHLWILLAIYKGNSELTMFTAEGSGDHWDRGSAFVTTHLKKGDIVYVRRTGGGSTFLEAGPFTTFSGFLVAAD